MSEPITPQPRRMVDPAAANPRRQAFAMGAGALALVGAAAVGAATLLGGGKESPKEVPEAQDPLGGDPLNLDEAVLGSPSKSSPSPVGNNSEGEVEASMEPDASSSAGSSGTSGSGTGSKSRSSSDPTITQKSKAGSKTKGSGGNNVNKPASQKRRVLHDPVDNQLPMQQQQPTSALEAGRDSQARQAQIRASDAYKAEPPTPTLKGESALAPGLQLHTTPAWHLARRAAIGATAAIAAQIEAQGTEAWIDAQLSPESIDDGVVEGIIASNFSWATSSAASVATKTEDTFKVGPQLVNSLLMRTRFSNRVLAENVFDALANHIYVPAMGKSPLYSGEYDQLLRRHGLGRYADLLYAALTHPALLVELDNQVNTKANPNENLGRELLELYTVGAGSYGEADVRNSALLLTGHGLDWKTHKYVYEPRNHHTGAVKVMGFSDANTDAAKGPALLRRYVEYLAKHPNTAKRLARRFAVRFISDNPSDATVQQLADVYLKSNTQIKALVKATLTHPDFAKSLGKKWRRPGELIGTIARSAQVSQVTPRGRVGSGKEFDFGIYGYLIETGRDLPRNWPIVDGYPDTANYWNSASLTLQMLNATQDAVMGDSKESGVTSWTKALSISPGDDAVKVSTRITWHLTGYRWPDDMVRKVAKLMLPEDAQTTALTEKGLDDRVAHAVRVIFASPYASLR